MDYITLIGFIAAFFTTLAFLPQVVKSYKTCSTKDVSLGLISLQSSGNALWITYGILQKDIVIIVANIFTLALVIFLLALKIRYK